MRIDFFVSVFALAASMAHAEIPGAIQSESGAFQIVLDRDPSTMPLSEFVELKATIHDAQDAVVTGATLAIGGGMPAHGHGLPTQPEAEATADGSFVIKGLKFSMPGDWVLIFDIKTDSAEDRVTVDFRL